MFQLRVAYHEDGRERWEKILEIETFQGLLRHLWDDNIYGLSEKHELEILKKNEYTGLWTKLDLENLLLRSEWDEVDKEIESNGFEAAIFRPDNPAMRLKDY